MPSGCSPKMENRKRLAARRFFRLVCVFATCNESRRTRRGPQRSTGEPPLLLLPVARCAPARSGGHVTRLQPFGLSPGALPERRGAQLFEPRSPDPLARRGPDSPEMDDLARAGLVGAARVPAPPC